MKIIQAGPYQIDDGSFESDWSGFISLNKVNVILYWYESGSYEGHGIALLKTKDGFWFETDLNHCSCNGPTDGGAKFNLIGSKRKLVEWFKNDSVRDRSPKDFDYNQIMNLKKCFERI
jgi:hypothetical protein